MHVHAFMCVGNTIHTYIIIHKYIRMYVGPVYMYVYEGVQWCIYSHCFWTDPEPVCLERLGPVASTFRDIGCDCWRD